MALSHSPGVVTDGLTLYYDAASLKSFRGINATNISNLLNNNQQSNQNGTYFKITNGSEVVEIPGIGSVTSKYVDIFNNYSGGSGICCPNLFSYGVGLPVTGSTVYTYSLIYKTSNGYTHPNYMYRYEYNSSGTFLIEGGVHSDSNRISLGDGWYFAWGQFTTQSTAATINTFLFHYEYSTYNRVYVAKAAIYQGSFVIPYQHFLNTGEVRGTTVATGGGWADLTGNSNNGQLVNGVSEDSSSLGSLVFDGTNDRVDCGTNFSSFITGTNPFTIECWVYPNSTQVSYADIWGNHAGNYTGLVMQNNGGTGNTFAWGFGTGSTWHPGSGFFTLNSLQYNHLVAIRSSSNTLDTYLNGVQVTNTSAIGYSLRPNSALNFQIGVGFDLNSNRYFNGRISNFKIYRRALTAAEVLQNFNAHRGRYGI